jgi:hypothetical protein
MLLPFNAPPKASTFVLNASTAGLSSGSGGALVRRDKSAAVSYRRILETEGVRRQRFEVAI